ncbi:hypothetical protein TorRG33x02_044550 [Trema orientale]|uniref:Uncharacterized protein n=1 Tax=Trema orientale TaxID=63057 RepID=A0A2P5FPM6_TREOI|nr:hypothetical protein TorRG33x02_044550 [Trema orientale]
MITDSVRGRNGLKTGFESKTALVFWMSRVTSPIQPGPTQVRPRALGPIISIRGEIEFELLWQPRLSPASVRKLRSGDDVATVQFVVEGWLPSAPRGEYLVIYSAMPGYGIGRRLRLASSQHKGKLLVSTTDLDESAKHSLTPCPNRPHPKQNSGNLSYLNSTHIASACAPTRILEPRRSGRPISIVTRNPAKVLCLGYGVRSISNWKKKMKVSDPKQRDSKPPSAFQRFLTESWNAPL